MTTGPARDWDVCVVGSANLDLVATAARLPTPGETVLGHTFAEHAGGKGLNQAIAAARAGARTAFVGTVGADSAGAGLRAALTGDGVDTVSLTHADDTPTGRALIGVNDAGDNAIIVVQGANAAMRPDTIATARSVRSATVLPAQLEIPLAAVVAALRAGRAAGAVTILDPAPPRPLPPEVLSLCDIVVPNEHEIDELGGVDGVLAGGCRCVVLTMGAAGARAVRAGEEPVDVAPFRVVARDTTAAGDAFRGVLAARLAAGVPFADALRDASAPGALATTVAGAVSSLPYDAAIRRLVSGGG